MTNEQSEQIRQKAIQFVKDHGCCCCPEHLTAFAESLLSGGAADCGTPAEATRLSAKVVPMSCLDSSVLQTDKDGEYQVRTSRLTCNTAASEMGFDSGTGEESDPKIAGAAPPAASRGQPKIQLERLAWARSICSQCASGIRPLVKHKGEWMHQVSGQSGYFKCSAAHVWDRTKHEFPAKLLEMAGEIRARERAASGSGTPATPSAPTDAEDLLNALPGVREKIIAAAVERERQACAAIAERDANMWTPDGARAIAIAESIRSRASQPATNWVPHYPRLDEIIEEFQRLTRERKEREKQDAGLRSGEGIQVLAEDGSDSGAAGGRSDNDVRVPHMAGEVNPAQHIHTASCYKCGHDDCPCHGGYIHELPMCAEGPAAKDKP